MKSLKVERERERERCKLNIQWGKKGTNKEWVRKENGCGREKAIKDEFGENDFSVSLITKRKAFIQAGTQPPKTE